MVQPMRGNEQGSQQPVATRDSTAGRTLKKIFRQEDIFGRIEPQTASRSLLMKPLRLSLFIHLCENPCDHMRAIARSVGMSVSSANWNLSQLAGAGYIGVVGIGCQKVYWPMGMVESADLGTIKVARSAKSEKALKAIHSAGGQARQRDIVSGMGGSQQSVEFQLRKMVSMGILSYQGGIYSVSPGFAEMAEHYLARAGEFSRTALAILRDDGLMPRRHRLRRTRLSVDIRLPPGVRRIQLECDPLANIRKYLGA